MHLVWSPLADSDLDEIVSYIQQDSPASAVRVEDRIVEGVEMLTQFPQLDRLGRASGTRELVVSGTPYVVAYRVEAETVTILRVLHGAQQWPDALAQP